MAGFCDITGHREVIRYLKAAIRNNRISHVYLFTGDNGAGKRTMARAFAQALQCTERIGQDSCGKCDSCLKARSMNHPDIIEWGHEKPKLFSVDDARELSRDISVRPYTDERKIYIVPDADLMNTAAQNALLKTLEEPPEYAVIMLLGRSADALLETVRSRCTILNLGSLNDDDVLGYIVNKMHIDEHEAETYVAYAQGNIGRVVLLFKSSEIRDLLEEVMRILTHITEWRLSEIAAAVDRLTTQKDFAEDILAMFTAWYRDVLYFKTTQDSAGVILRNWTKEISHAAQRSSFEGLQTIIEALKSAGKRLRANVNFELTMELLLLTMKEK